MFGKELSRLLSISIEKRTQVGALRNVEHNVWSKIHAIKQDENVSWYDKMLQAMSVWQFQVSSVAFSLIFGLVVGMSISPSTYDSNKANMDLQSFSSNSPYLLSTQLVRNYEEALR